jgi:hypothetical protein
MLNYIITNFAYSWLIAMVFLFILNLSIKAYKFLRYSYLFDVSVERFGKGTNILTLFKFSNVYSSPNIKWGGDKSFHKMIDIVLYMLYNNQGFIESYSNKILT